MAAYTMLHPPRMNAVHGIRALAVATVAEATGTAASPDHAIAIALISVVGGFVVMIVQILVKDWLTRRTPAKHPDHSEEQAELNQYLIGELHRLTVENERLRGRRR